VQCQLASKLNLERQVTRTDGLRPGWEGSMSTEEAKKKTDRDALAALLANARLNPGPEQFEEIAEAFEYVKAMTARLHSGFPFEAEPAHVFTPLKF
jgi:hypothetical protein